MVDVGFTGTQEGMTVPQADRFRTILGRIEDARFHHGDCVGSDRQAHAIALELGWYIVIHPPSNSAKRAFCVADEERPARPYLVRNRDIVNETAVLLATPDGFQERTRSGTWSTVRYARRIGRPYVIIFPDGSISAKSRAVDIFSKRP